MNGAIFILPAGPSFVNECNRPSLSALASSLAFLRICLGALLSNALVGVLLVELPFPSDNPNCAPP
jgi:hypothetical protein